MCEGSHSKSCDRRHGSQVGSNGRLGSAEAGFNLMWVITSLVGPTYSASVAEAVGWRWCLLLYLPILLAARGTMVRQLKDANFEKGDTALPWKSAVLMSLGVATISGSVELAVNPGLFVLCLLLGAAGVLVGGYRFLPRGTLRATRGRATAVGLLERHRGLPLLPKAALVDASESAYARPSLRPHHGTLHSWPITHSV